jgi:NAD(P)-dependent dehydrogenase (short-subunit alcohol dehydrogenase family)
MLLKDKNAVIYGAGGSIGSKVARAFARDGAKVFLAGLTLAKVEAVAEEISVARGIAEAAQSWTKPTHATFKFYVLRSASPNLGSTSSTLAHSS